MNQNGLAPVESYREMMARILVPQRVAFEENIRAFQQLGEVLVNDSDTYYGVDKADVRDQNYARYIATSSHVYTCIKKRAVNLTSVPLILYKGKGKKRKPYEDGKTNELFDKVNPYWTFRRLLEATEQDLCLHGEAFWYLDRGGKNDFAVPSSIWRVRPDRMMVVPDKTKYIAGYIYEPDNFSLMRTFGPKQIVWFRYPNPLNEFKGLPPLAAALLSVDTTQSGMLSNQALFRHGLQLAGVIRPKGNNTTLTKIQAQEILSDLDLRFSGKDKSHRWAVFRTDVDFTPLSISPKDAEFLGLINWGLSDVANVFGVPQDLVGGQRTYENVDAAMKAFWMFCLRPECQFIADEITEQVLPLFQGEADTAEFDLKSVEVLHESENSRWTRFKEQMDKGIYVANDWLEQEGDPVKPWGTVWWAPVSLVPIRDDKDLEAMLPANAPDPIEQAQKMKELAAPEPDPNADQKSGTAGWFRTLDYGSSGHAKFMQMFERRTATHEAAIMRMVQDLFRRQRDSVLSRLKEGEERSVASAAMDPFDKGIWKKRFMEGARPVFRENIIDMGNAALNDLALDSSFNMDDPNARRFLEQRTQRFATRVNDTTYKLLQDSLNEGISDHETVGALSERVTKVMGDRIRSSAETIARTEVIGASNGGTLEAWKQSGVVETKRWLAALDSRTRSDHVAAHGQEVALDANFIVGGYEGPFLVASEQPRRTSSVGAP